MDMLSTNRINLYDPSWPISSRSPICPPHYTGRNACIRHSIVTEGCEIDGHVENSVLSSSVKVGSGAKVLGPFKVGDNARIAANSVVLHEVPPDSTVVGVPGRVVRRNGEKLDHIHTPDPIRLELDALYARIEKLEEKLKEDQDVSL